MGILRGLEGTTIFIHKENIKNIPALESFKTTSEISNNFRGRGSRLFADSVFSNPGSKVVRATWNSSVLGFEMWTAGTSLIESPSLDEMSSLEQRANVSASVKPACAISSRS